jgi:hypothetical protein
VRIQCPGIIKGDMTERGIGTVFGSSIVMLEMTDKSLETHIICVINKTRLSDSNISRQEKYDFTIKNYIPFTKYLRPSNIIVYMAC